MSGGTFGYEQIKIGYIAENIDYYIENNGKEKPKAEVYFEGDTHYYEYSADIIEEFKYAAYLLRKAEIYTQRIDWLIAGDDSEETFKKKLSEDLKELEEWQKQL